MELDVKEYMAKWCQGGMKSVGLSACPKRMHRLGTNGKGKSRGNCLTQVHPENGSLKQFICMSFCTVFLCR